ncbi:hypothetical protein BGAL_0559g00010 [Botrytis galanthina]|uniref:Uncharacterized protein n=1 Tax=Botrytis galanthina TaxID=278940 RepID=A0A4S8QLS7_9HELO|nr:hypothetical protein BGAL_0559g00010 [Botrytis galanthina]
MVSTKIILWTGILLATAFATATIYGFLSNPHYKVLRCLRFPATLFFPTTLYFIMNFNYQEILELINKSWPFFETIYKHVDFQKVEKLIENLPFQFWLITALTICIWGAHSTTTSFFKEYYQQNEYASQSTSGILYTFNNIANSPQACFQTIFAGVQACSQTVFAGVQACSQTVFTGNASHFPIVCLCTLFCMGIALLIASLLFSKGNQRLAFVATAIILASPAYILLVRWTINF